MEKSSPAVEDRTRPAGRPVSIASRLPRDESLVDRLFGLPAPAWRSITSGSLLLCALVLLAASMVLVTREDIIDRGTAVIFALYGTLLSAAWFLVRRSTASQDPSDERGIAVAAVGIAIVNVAYAAGVLI